nr:hypothetical protein [Tanacetum cinerariifolium]
DHAAKVLSMQEDEPKVQEVVEVVTNAKLIIEVETAASTPVSAASTIIPAAEPKVPAATITAAPVKESTAKTPAETKSKDKGKGIMVEESKPIKKKQQVKIDEAYARKLHEALNQDIDWDVAIDHIKQKAKEDPYVQRYQIVPNEDNDVYTEATPLARKVPVVDYQIVHFNNKPYYKIIRADRTHQLYSQRSVHGQAMVKSWKLLKLCGVHIISFTTTQLILLVEKRYPLSRFTLDQMLNVVRLQVEEQSETSLELLRFTR